MKIGWPKGSERWRGWLKQYQTILLVVGAGLLLMLLPTGGGGTEEAAPAAVCEESVAEFEQRLEQVLSKIRGAGTVRVVLTVDAGSRRVLAQDVEQQEGSQRRTTVTLDEGAQDGVVPLQTISPTFRGALVVCSGGNDPQVRLDLTQAVAAVTGLGSDSIAVMQGT